MLNVVSKLLLILGVEAKDFDQTVEVNAFEITVSERLDRREEERR